MSIKELWKHIKLARNDAEIQIALQIFESSQESLRWENIGGRENNAGTIEITSDPGRAFIERITNAIDAIIEQEHDTHNGIPECGNPREAVKAWLGVPPDGLNGLSQQARQQLADRLNIRIENGGEDKKSYTLTVTDNGIGISADRMPNTILSLNQENKLKKPYLAGTYGQGGSSTFWYSKYTLIASSDTDGHVAFTIIKYMDLPADQYDTGKYVYLTLNGSIACLNDESFKRGTIIKHYGYDFYKYSGSVGPTSLYGLLSQMLFDPVLPFWLEHRIHDYRRSITGARNRLNKHVFRSETHDKQSSVEYNQSQYNLTVGNYGDIGIEYWVLEAPKDKKSKNPANGYIDSAKPVIFTRNGQNQHELTRLIIQKEAELPMLVNRLIVHINCDSITHDARRQLFSSNREQARKGEVLETIRKEIVRALKTDENLIRLNKEARDRALEQRDEDEERKTRQEVASLLRMRGIKVSMGNVASKAKDGKDKTDKKPRPTPRPPTPVSTCDPPTFINILPDNEKPLEFYPGQRKYIRIKTNAADSYHRGYQNAENKINYYINSEAYKIVGSTPLADGNFRIIVDATDNTEIITEASLNIDLTRTSMSPISATKNCIVVERPEARDKSKTLTLPPFDFIPIEGPDDEKWGQRGWPDDDENFPAFDYDYASDELIIYYSAVYPDYTAKLRRFENHSDAKAKTYKKRYEVWLAVFSLIESEKAKKHPESTEEAAQNDKIRNFSSTASLAALFAQRECDILEKELLEGID